MFLDSLHPRQSLLDHVDSNVPIQHPSLHTRFDVIEFFRGVFQRSFCLLDRLGIDVAIVNIVGQVSRYNAFSSGILTLLVIIQRLWNNVSACKSEAQDSGWLHRMLCCIVSITSMSRIGEESQAYLVVLMYVSSMHDNNISVLE